jgi:hypothetical protein
MGPFGCLFGLFGQVRELPAWATEPILPPLQGSDNQAQSTGQFLD